MKRHLARLTVGIALAAAQCFAREPGAPPSPVVEGNVSQVGTTTQSTKGNSLFVGHYGEILELPYGWTAEAELKGETEAVYIHRKSHDEFGRRPFQPKKSDFKPENFTPMGLMELVVIPKNAPGGLRSLKELRRAKENELKQNRVNYKISEVVNDSHWPVGTFHVEASQPYRLVQTYAESQKEFYILTVGGHLEEGDYKLSTDQISEFHHANIYVSESLGDHLLAIHKKSPKEFLFRPEPRDANDFSAPFSLFRLRITAGAINAALLILALFPGNSPRARRARLFGWSLFLTANLMAFIGFLAVYIPVHLYGVLWRNSAAAELIPILLFPWISWIAAKRSGSSHPSRVLISIGILSAILALDIFRGSRLDSARSADVLAYETTLLLFALGLALGGVFAAAFGPLPQKGDRR